MGLSAILFEAEENGDPGKAVVTILSRRGGWIVDDGFLILK
jgi:hypothetical protein